MAQSRHEDFVNKTRQGFAQLEEIAAELKKLMARGNLTAEDLAPIIGALDKLAPPAANILGASKKLTHRRSDIEARAIGEMAAITGGVTPPGSADLAATKDVQITQEIRDLATQVLNDPAEIFRYVRDNIESQLYFGSVKGSAGTYWEKAGNDMDQASLLLALLRAANIPCRYISGVVTVSAAEMMNWTGAKTPEAAINMLAANGIPFQYRTRHNGTITQFRFFHTWVSVFLGKSGWVSLAPAFKEYEYHDGIDIKQAMGFDLNVFYNNATAGATIDPSYVANLNEANITNDLQISANNLLTWVNANLPGATVGEVMGYRKIVPIGTFRSLSRTFPFKKATEQYEFAELPTSWRYLANFQMYGFSYDISMPELYGKRLSLAYVPATPEDQAIIDQYGGIFNVPAYLVNMKPQLKLEDQVVGEGQGVMLGTFQGCWSSFLRPLGSAWDTNEKMVTTGADYSISFDHQRISFALLQQRIANFQNLVDNLPGGIVTQEVVEEALHLTGMIYFAETDGMNDMAAVSSKIFWTREPSQNFIARDLLVLYGWYAPYQVQRGAIAMDVKRDELSPTSIIGNADDERIWMLTSGSFSSAAEHAVFEQLYQVESVSTEKILTLANRSGIPIYTLDRNNIEQIRPLLSLPEAMPYIDDEVINQGLTVIVPQRNIQLNQWQGAGWIVMDPQSGGATYYILGSLLWGVM